MKKKLFVLLAVLCLVALIVPMTVGAATVTVAETTITIENGGDVGCYEFTAPESGHYTICSQTGDGDPYGELYDSEKNLLLSNDDGGEDLNFGLIWTMEEGETYYIYVHFLSDMSTGDIPIVITRAEYSESEYDTVLYADTDTNVLISYNGEEVLFPYTPAYTESYTFYSSSEYDTCGALYDSDWNMLYYSDDDGENSNFEFTCELEAGVTYYFGVRYYSSYYVGIIPVYLRTNHSYAERPITEPTCTTDGLAECVCEVCGYSYEKVLPAAHSWDEEGNCTECEAEWFVEGACGDYATWYLDGSGTLTISGYGAMADYGWYSTPWYEYIDRIQSIVVGDGITYIGQYAFAECYCVTSVTLPDSVTGIGNYVFYGCYNLTSVALQEGLEYIGSRAFLYCDNLSSIELPEGLGWIGEYAFGDCFSLETIRIPASVYGVGAQAFNGCTSLDGIWVDEDNPNYSNDAWGALYEGNNLHSAPSNISGHYTVADGTQAIYPYAFQSCEDLTSVTIPTTVTDIGYAAFSYSGLTSIEIPDSVTYMGSSMFECCAALTSVILPDGMEQIPWGMFGACPMLTNVTIPDSVTEINANAFQNCTSLASVTIPDSVTAIHDYAFVHSGLTSIVIPGSVTYLGWDVFYDCSELTSVTISGSITNLSAGSFYGCAKLSSVTLPDSLDTVDMNAFRGCTALTSITLPDSLLVLAYGAFYDSGLTSIVLPGNLSYIDDCVFYGCEDLTEVVFAGNAPSAIGTDMFNGLTATVYYPADNNTWTEDVMQDWGGDVTWKAFTTGAITSQPSTQKVKAGNTATFKVTASGTDLTYQWQTKTSSSGSWKNCTFTGSKTASMSVPATTARNGYYYRCKITDVAGNVVYTNTVRLYALGVKTQPTTQKVKAGATATFTVSATGSGKTYQWQTKTSSSSSWKNCTFTGSKTATMSVPATTGRNGYYYRCKITDSAGNVVYTNSVRLYVLGIKTQPATQKVKAGSTAKFTVSATGYGLSYQWQTKTSSSGSWKNCTFTGSKTATMSVSATTARNGYYYRCKITDSAGNVTYTNTVRLYVLGIKTQPTSKTVKSGSTAKFTVSATGSGLTYQWQYKTSSGWKNTTLTGAKTATLSVKGTSARNGMKYRCKITDSAGNVIYTNTVKLTVK